MAARDTEPIVVIGRGRSGTRILAYTLYSSGVYMGRWLNESGDKVPARDLHDACRIVAQHVRRSGCLSWDFSRLHTMPIDSDFRRLVEGYLEDLLSTRRARWGWKLPETTLVYPWLVRMFPGARYVHIVRDPRDSLFGTHQTDDLDRFGIPHPGTDDLLGRRIASWKYQYDIVEATPKPSNFIRVRYEDMVMDQERTLEHLERFLGMPLARVIVDKDRIGKWKADPSILDRFTPLEEAMRACGYGLPE